MICAGFTLFRVIIVLTLQVREVTPRVCSLDVVLVELSAIKEGRIECG